MRPKNSIILLLPLILILASTLTCASSEPSSSVQSLSVENADTDPEDELAREFHHFETEDIMQALYQAYPHRIQQIAFLNDDWALRIDDAWYYYAHGRFLPEAIHQNWEAFDPIPFYTYPEDLPPFSRPVGRVREHLSTIIERWEADPPNRNPAFLNAIWEGHDRNTTSQNIKTTWFLGRQLTIHRSLLSVLASVEREVRFFAKEDPELAAYIESIDTVSGYNYREIANTKSLSYHSYGAAIDLLPDYYEQKYPYWLWASNVVDDWYDLPYEQRYMLPQSLVDIFERHGFLWGGKWLLFDTIHFEYRPEILLLNGFTNEGIIIQNIRFH